MQSKRFIPLFQRHDDVDGGDVCMHNILKVILKNKYEEKFENEKNEKIKKKST
jgi:hypothetical protein